jgi:cytochrome c-type biogenesis protein CcmH
VIRAVVQLTLMSLLCTRPALAVSDPREMLPNNVEEMRAEAIGHRLRCLVCQNESVEDSDAGLARDLRRVIRVRVAEGSTDQQAVDWMVARYGDFIRLRPPFDAETLLLWIAPLLSLAIGCSIVLISARRGIPPAAPLTSEEHRRLARLRQS